MAHIPTFNGTSQILSNESKFGTHGCYFDGNTGYLTIPNSDDWNFGTGDFTIDYWSNASDGSAVQLGDIAYSPLIGYSSSNGLFLSSNGTSWDIALNVSMGSWDGEWNHYAVVRNGNNFYTFKNGVKISTFTNSSSIWRPSSIIRIGRAGSNYLKGSIDEFRISKGVARWTSNFTPPTSKYSSDTNTKLLLHFDVGDINSSTSDESLKDSGNTGHTVTANGVCGAVSRFGDGGYYFDGDSDYLTLPDSDNWDLWTTLSESWTVDFWVRHTDHESQEAYISQYAGGGNNELFWMIYHNHGNGLRMSAYLNSGATKYVETAYGGEITDNKWHHIALVVKGGSSTRDTGLYKDGVQVGYSNRTDVAPGFSGPLYIAQHGRTSYNYYFDGYLDEVRIQKGNYFNASPNSSLTNTITVPTSIYSTEEDIVYVPRHGAINFQCPAIV